MDGREDPQTPLLAVRDLKIRLGEPSHTVVDGISFDLHRGQIHGLAGESGSGKSITAGACIGQFPSVAKAKASGSIHLEGDTVNLLEASRSHLRAIRRHAIRTISQEPSTTFNPVLTVGAQLKESLRLAGEKGNLKLAAESALESVGISAKPNILKAYPAMFSGGMLQRLAIACALTAKPKLLIADEPTTALDTTTQKRILNLLHDLNQQYGMAILFISHDLRLLKGFTDSLMIMKEGSIVEAGPTEQVLQAPEHPYTRKLIASLPGWDAPA